MSPPSFTLYGAGSVVQSEGTFLPSDPWDISSFILAILVTGGHDTSTSAEVLHLNGSSLCNLPDMPQSKDRHTQSGLIACGGYDSTATRKSCIKFQSGSWKTVTENLLELRYYHSSWANEEDEILLIGGFASSTTTEIVYQNGTSIRSFVPKYNTM